MNTKPPIEQFIDLKNKVYSFGDTSNDLMILQSYLLQNVGYEVKSYKNYWFYNSEEHNYLVLDAFLKTLYNTSSLHCLGIYKYFCVDDVYEINIHDGVNSCTIVTKYKEKNNFLILPFTPSFPCTIGFKVVSFGGNNQACLENSLALDYDNIARELAQNMAPHLLQELPSILKNNDFLRLLPKNQKSFCSSSWLLFFSLYLKQSAKIEEQILFIKHFISTQEPPKFVFHHQDFVLTKNPCSWKVKSLIIKNKIIKSWHFFKDILPFT